MNSVKANLLANVVSSYDPTKTTIQGRVFQKTINGTEVLGPPLNKFVDTVADSAGTVVPVLSFLSPNGRLFSIGGEGSGVSLISCHEIDLDTGDKTYVGAIRFSLPDNAATTHTLRSLKVIDTGTTGWKIYVATTGSVLINGGLFCGNNIDKTDFIPVGSTLIPFATGSNQKAVYFLQDPLNIGVNQLNVATAGTMVDVPNNKIYVHNGVAATHQYYVYNTNSTLNCPTTVGVTIDSTTDFLTQTSHGYLNNDPILIQNLSGGAGLVNNGIYYVRNVTLNTYQVSLTSGGAVINITTNGTCDVSRAFGTSSSAWSHKTGNLPALTGTLIVSDSEDYAIPGHTTNAGFTCVFFSTSSNLYLGRVSELTPGAVTWPSLVTSNILGTVNQIVAPTLTLSTWSNVLDAAIYLTNANVLIMKKVINNSIEKVFAGVNNIYREGTISDVVELGWTTTTALDVEDGWLIVNGSTVGQRGQVLCDLRSDQQYDYSYIVTPVLETPASIYKYITTTDELYNSTGSLRVQYRTSGFGSISGGWSDIGFAEDLTAVASGSQTQFKILFDTLSLDTCIHAQLQEFFLGLESLFEISSNWEYSDDWSTSGVPTRVALRLKQAYVGAVPTLFFRAYNLSDALLITNDTVTNAANFEYSADNGTSWLPLGTIPNTVGTLIRYSFTTPPGVDIRPSIKES